MFLKYKCSANCNHCMMLILNVKKMFFLNLIIINCLLCIQEESYLCRLLKQGLILDIENFLLQIESCRTQILWCFRHNCKFKQQNFNLYKEQTKRLIHLKKISKLTKIILNKLPIIMKMSFFTILTFYRKTKI